MFGEEKNYKLSLAGKDILIKLIHAFSSIINLPVFECKSRKKKLNAKNASKDSIINATWQTKIPFQFSSVLKVVATDRVGLAADLFALLASEKVNLKCKSRKKKLFAFSNGNKQEYTTFFLICKG